MAMGVCPEMVCVHILFLLLHLVTHSQESKTLRVINWQFSLRTQIHRLAFCIFMHILYFYAFESLELEWSYDTTSWRSCDQFVPLSWRWYASSIISDPVAWNFQTDMEKYLWIHFCMIGPFSLAVDHSVGAVWAEVVDFGEEGSNSSLQKSGGWQRWWSGVRGYNEEQQPCLQLGRFILDMRKDFFIKRLGQPCNRPPREVAVAPSLGVFKVPLHKAVADTVT